MSCCCNQTLGKRLLGMVGRKDDIFKSTTVVNKDSSEAKVNKESTDQGIIITSNSPIESVVMDRLDDENESVNGSSTFTNENKDQSIRSNTSEKSGSVNALTKIISSIGERFNDQKREEHPKQEVGEAKVEEEKVEEEKVEEEKAPEEKKDKQKTIDVNGKHETRNTMRKENSFLSFFAAREKLSPPSNGKLEKFEDDNSIVIEENVTEEKVDFHIETTVQISPQSTRSTESIVRANSALNLVHNSSTLSAKNKSRAKKNLKSLKSVDELDDDILSKLAQNVPDATDAERKRFLVARKGNYKATLDQLREYVQWRKDCRLDEDETDEFGHNMPHMTFGSHTVDDGYISCASSVGAQDRSDWAYAAEAAVAFFKDGKSKFDAKLPQLAHMVTEIGSETYLKDNCGNRILLLLPAQVNIEEVNEEIYALAIGFYLDRKLDRESMEKIVVAIDLRAGEGWPNPPAKKVVPFVKCVVSLLERNFPERLALSILFPLPTAATVLWRVVKMFLDPNTAAKIAVIGGNSGVRDTVSMKKFEKFVDKAAKHRMEEIRVECFVTGRKINNTIV